MLLALARWPPCNLPTLSILQDPLDLPIDQKQHFAQPLVFFRLNPLSALVRSSYLHSVANFRLRIPSRLISPYICDEHGSLPSLNVLDLSTCHILESDIDALLVRFQKMQHLILDKCRISRGELREGEWAALGKICALSGVKRAKEREKQLKSWLEANTVHSSAREQQMDLAPESQGQVATRRGRRGRRGLATATISLRASPPREDSSPRTIPNGVVIPKIRILPSTPSILSLATTTHSIAHDKHTTIRDEFERGWIEGLAQVNAIRARLLLSWKNGIRVVRFSNESHSTEDGLDGLVDVESGDEITLIGDTLKSPVLCLAGAGRDGKHVEGCGHTVAWGIWKDEL
jgi:hypothetical protein